jgi:cyclic lactone autoinducer peptide
MKLTFKGLYTVLAAVATVLAASIATSACIWFVHQPEEPKCLRDE